MFDFMFPRFAYDESGSVGQQNPGGGMATKQKALDKVLSERYFFNWITDFSEVKHPILVIDPLILRMNNSRPDTMDLETWTSQWVEDLAACPAKKILYCSEQEPGRWSPNLFSQILEHVDVVTANTAYQTSLIWTLSNGERYPYYLCDPIDTELFHPSPVKKPRVFGAGRIAKFKNTEFLIEVFKAIKTRFGDAIETAYFGNASLWGLANSIDDKIAGVLKNCVDFYRGGISRATLARLFGESLFYISKTTHDVYSSTHAEALASGCISIGGGHPLFQERPGIAGLKTVVDYVNTVEQLISESEAQCNERQATSRGYVEEHCGFEAFHRQFKAVLEMVR